MKKMTYKKGDMVKTEDGVILITDATWLNVTVYKGNLIKVSSRILLCEDNVFYKVKLEELNNEIS